MLLFVIGLPSRFTEWCADVAKRFAEQSLGAPEMIPANTLSEISRALIGRGTALGVVRSTNPGGPLRAALDQGGHGFIVAIDDPRRARVELVITEAGAFPAALRRVASSCAAISRLMSAQKALVLLSERDGAN